MALVEGETDIYSASIPVDNDKLIFVRLNGETTGYNWDEKWSQTKDLDFPGEGLDLFTVTSGGTGSECDGAWSKYDQGGATAISNMDVEAKTLKVIEDGQMFILKNGVRYNAQGAVVK